MMKIDLHCHTSFSPDSITPLEEIPPRCHEQGITVLAITDHGVITGAQRLKQMVEASGNDSLTIIVGEEIRTSAGELIGLFLNEGIPHDLSPEETVRRIQAQDGLILLPHAFDPWKRLRLRADVRERIADSIDIVETFNASVSRKGWNQAAIKWAEAKGKAKSAGSDAHAPGDIGKAWVEVPFQPIEGPDDLMGALDLGVPMGRWTHPLISLVFHVWDRVRRFIRV